MVKWFSIHFSYERSIHAILTTSCGVFVFIFKFLFFNVCVYLCSACGCKCKWSMLRPEECGMCGAWLNLVKPGAELKAAVSLPTRIPGAELKSSAGQVHIFNCWSLSPALCSVFEIFTGLLVGRDGVGWSHSLPVKVKDNLQEQVFSLRCVGLRDWL